jgi:serine/threonine protein kinase
LAKQSLDWNIVSILAIGANFRVHEHDIAHRDIKPDNLLRGTDGFIKFVDFGVSEMFEKGQDRSKKSAGSPAFFSPEMCTAQHGEMSTKACDIWALGVTLFCLCFGKLPFVGHTILELYENIRDQPLVVPDGCSPELKDLLEKMMRKNPAERITLTEIRVRFWKETNWEGSSMDNKFIQRTTLVSSRKSWS